MRGVYEGLDRLDPTVDKTSGGSVTRTVTYYPVAGAMRINSTLYYVLKDHLGSASVVTDASGNTVGEQRYYPYGETRLTSGTIYTDKLFTGQREMAGLGIYHYGARFYSQRLGRFLSADTIVPGMYSPQALNRYSYVLGNPLRYTDPTGHDPQCDADGYCDNKISTQTAIARLKVRIKSKYGITMSDGGEKNWTLQNLSLMNTSLANVDTALNGNLKSLANGWTFTMRNQNPDNGQYHGVTHTNGGKIIDFYTLGDAAMRQMNIYHEVGHLLDNIPGLNNVFTNAVPDNLSWVSNGKVSSAALDSASITTDPNYSTVQAIQAYNKGESEEWADAFANYVAGNINLGESKGLDMYKFVTGALEPYTRYYP